MADVLEPEVFTAGDYIVREDTHGDTFYILAKGEVRVTKKVEGEEKHIRHLTQGEYFGEQVTIYILFPLPQYKIAGPPKNRYQNC